MAYIVAGVHLANTLEAAHEIADDIFADTGAIVAIEHTGETFITGAR